MKLTKINGVYHARYRAGKTPAGKPKWQTITTKCTVRDEAMKVVQDAGIPQIERAAMSGQLTREVVGRITAGRKLALNDCLAPFEEWMGACAKSPKTIVCTLSYIRQWIAEMKVGTMNPNGIEPSHIARWVNNPKHTDKLTTRKVSLANVRMFFKFLAVKGWIMNNPAEQVAVDYDVLSHEQKEVTERVPFTEPEVRTLIAQTDDIFWKFAIRCSWETGLRLSDICNLQWKCFVQSGKMVVWQGKTNQRIEHTLSPALEDLISQIPVSDATYVFPDQHTLTQDVKRRALLSMQFIRLCERCSIEGKSFHCLRHTAGTNASQDEESAALVRELVDKLGVEKARQLLGHTSSKMTRRYIHKS